MLNNNKFSEFFFKIANNEIDTSNIDNEILEKFKTKYEEDSNSVIYSNYATINIHDFFLNFISSKYYNDGMRKSIESYKRKYDIKKDLFKNNLPYNATNVNNILMDLINYSYYIVLYKDDIMNYSNTELDNFDKDFVFIYSDLIAELFLCSQSENYNIYSIANIFKNLYESFNFNDDQDSNVTNFFNEILNKLGADNSFEINFPSKKLSDNPFDKKERINKINSVFSNILDSFYNRFNNEKYKNLLDQYRECLNSRFDNISNIEDLYEFQQNMISTIFAIFILINIFIINKKGD